MEVPKDAFVKCLSIPCKHRTLPDILCIRSYLMSIESMASFKGLTISEFARIARYEQYKANFILFISGSVCTSWYILLSGRVMIGQAMFCTGKSFGHRPQGNLYRCDDCVLLEDSQFIVFDYSVDRRAHSNFNFSKIKNIDSISESNCTSDSDEDNSSQHVSSTKESFYDVIRKNPDHRTTNDIKTIFDGVHHLSAFRHFTSKTKYDLCRVMHVAIANKADKKLIDDGHIHDTWNVILDGIVEARYQNGSVREFSRGDSFGIRSANGEQQNGSLWTVTSLCLFFCVPQQYFVDIISRNADGIIPETETNGRVVLVYEERNASPYCPGSGRVVIKGSRDKLVNCLLEVKSDADPLFIENFLMAYRTFMRSPRELADKLCQCYEMNGLDNDSPLKMRIRKCLVLWANNHFGDFEHPNANMEKYLEIFETLLSCKQYAAKDRSLFLKACSNNSKTRSITVAIEKNGSEKPPFRLIGLQRGLGLFVKEINYAACKAPCSLRRGDQILSLENYSWERLDYLYKAVYMLNSNSTGSINMVVRYNPSGLQDVINDLSETESVFDYDSQNSDSRSMTGSVTLYGISNHAKDDQNRDVTESDVRRSRPCFPLSPPRKVKNNPRSAKTSPSRKVFIQKKKPKYTTVGHESGKSFVCSDNESSTKSFVVSQSIDLQEAELRNSNNGLIEFYQVLKVFRPSSSEFKLVLVTCNTMAKDAMTSIMKDFSIDISEIDNYALYMVSVNDDLRSPVIKSSRVSMYIKDLAGKLALNQRYYLSNNITTPQLMTDEQAKSLLNESKVTIGQLSAFEVATRLTSIDYVLFRNIQPMEYINFVLKLPPLEAGQQLSNSNISNSDKCGFSTGSENYEKFEELINRESYWPINEICKETNVTKRAELIKKFIKIAKLCKDLKNINSFICILMGLLMTPVDRLKASWDKVPSKYIKMYNDLRFLLDISFNFQKIRRMETNEPPLIPYLAIHIRDLSTMHMGNKTITKDGLINFEKLRMMTSEIRKLSTLCNTCYSLQTIISSLGGRTTPGFFASKMTNLSFDESDSTRAQSGVSNNSDNNSRQSRSSSVDQFAFNKDPKTKNDKKKSLNIRESQIKNPSKMYDEWLSTLKVRTYLSNLNILMDINRLQELSNALEPPSSVTSSSSNISSSVTSLDPHTIDREIHSEPLVTIPLPQKEDQTNKLKSSTCLKHLHCLADELLKGASKSIFSFQNPDDVDKIMDVVQDTKSQETQRRFRNNCDIDMSLRRKSHIYQNNREIIQAIGIRQFWCGIVPGSGISDFPVSDLLLETAISERAYRYPVAGGSGHNCFSEEDGEKSIRPDLPSYENARAIAQQSKIVTSCRSLDIINDGVTMRRQSTQLPSYNQAMVRTNNQDGHPDSSQGTLDMPSTLYHNQHSCEYDGSDEMTKI